MRSKHFECIKAIVAFYKEIKKNNNQVVCYKCCTSARSNSSNQKCQCGEIEGEKRLPKKLLHCRDCEAAYYKSFDPRREHKCGQSTCKFCQQYYKTGEVGTHRCPLFVDPSSLLKIFDGDENPAIEQLIQDASAEKLLQKNADRQARGWKPLTELAENRYQLWVWDIESCFKPVHIETEVFNIDEDGAVKLEPGDLEVTRMQKMAHVGNYVHCRNVFNDDEYEFDTLEDFIDFATVKNNKGYNYFLAHNSSGYDSRLLFEVACKHLTCPPEPVFKGSRMMRLTLNKAVFQDSFLHLSDSLATLGKGFQLATPKGYFPHLFSTGNFIDYNDKIPAKEYFDLTFTCKTEADFKAFNLWWKEWDDGYLTDKEKYTWNYRDQRRFYCRNDTLMLKQIVYIYHTEIIKSLKDYPYLTVSPWFFPTKAGHVHKLMLRHVHEGHYINSMSVEELKDYAQTTWCALEPEEHYFAHKALRGGMTNICKYIHEGRYHYQDIQSAYPSVQLDVNNLYPVGSPMIEVFDENSYPCRFCYASRKCTHNLEQKLDIESKHRQNKLKIKFVKVSDLHDYCLNFFGIITVDITPPTNLYHPLIQGYDHVKKKVIGSLEPIKMETLTSVMLIEAIKIGYVVTKIYRADRYTASESKWRNGLLGDMYVNKMRNAGKVKLEDQQRMKDTFMNKFKIDLGDFNTYEKNAVKKQVAKGPITAAWGKHAESVDHGKSVMFRQTNNDGMDFYRELLLNKSSLSNVRSVGNNMLFDYKENRQMKRPELHKTYLPAAVFVTAYGRLKLWRKLVEIDPPGTPKEKLRVMMYDTDSIVYECHDHENDQHIEPGDCLGDWEYEDIETDHKGLSKFYAIGPKSYAIVCADGTEKMKLKGAVIKHSHFRIMTPEVMKELVLSKKPGAVSKVATLPQMTFDYKLGYGEESMTTRYFRKIVQFHEKDVKGKFSWEDYRGYPDGFEV
jgi:hypothetical protein